jgi:hypothetical protein
VGYRRLYTPDIMVWIEILAWKLRYKQNVDLFHKLMEYLISKFVFFLKITNSKVDVVTLVPVPVYQNSDTLSLA